MSETPKETANDNQPHVSWDSTWNNTITQHEKQAKTELVLTYNLTADIAVVIYRVYYFTTTVTKAACLSKADDAVYRIVWVNPVLSVPVSNWNN